MSAPGELSREELLAALDELRAAVAERDAVIRALLAEVEQLKRRAGMDSSNSSMPPGSDGPAARAKRAKKPKKRSPRPRGGQAGHVGHALAWRSDPERITIIAPDACAGCGSTLADREGKVVARVQVFDTPPVKLQVTEYRMLQVAPGSRGLTCAASRAFSRTISIRRSDSTISSTVTTWLACGVSSPSRASAAARRSI
ncbi:DUF6444 domain-containing protein [Nonomuraea polychroma]|uniref:DUF6444 domain-containing protein n=1 Tax=Nonomuraea polychroma TaxID=46176 RepID=UPI003D8C76FF